MGQRLKIGELAKLTGVAADTIRYYERAGVLPCAARSAAGYRQYDDRNVQRLLFMRRARALGLPLRDLKALGDIFDSERPAAVRPRLLTLVRQQLSAVREHMADLRLLGRELEAAVQRLSSPVPMRQANGCSCLGTRDSSPDPRVRPGLQRPSRSSAVRA